MLLLRHHCFPRVHVQGLLVLIVFIAAMVFLLTTFLLFMRLDAASSSNLPPVSDSDPMQLSQPVLSQRAPTNESFKGSSMREVSHAMDLLENVCVTETPDVGGDIVWYSLDGSLLDLEKDAADKLPVGAWKELRRTAGKTLDQWSRDSAKGLLVANVTVLLHRLEENPAHCLSDLVFTLAEDVMSRDLKSRGPPPFYPSFLYKTFEKNLDTCPPTDWCCELMQSTGLINSTSGIVNKLPSLFDDHICFKRLLVPRLMHFRFPKLNQARSLQMLQGQAFKSLKLASHPWVEKELQRDVPILLYDRTGASRRVLKNAVEVKILLEQAYHTRVDLWGKAWEGLNFSSQAYLYNGYSSIVTPHGAHLSNLFFARPGTRLVEIQCTTSTKHRPPTPIINLTTKEEAKDLAMDWYGVAPRSPGNGLNWFTSISRLLSVEHFLYVEHEGCSGYSLENPRSHYSPATLSVDPSKFVSFIASRFGLTARTFDSRQ